MALRTQWTSRPASIVHGGRARKALWRTVRAAARSTARRTGTLPGAVPSPPNDPADLDHPDAFRTAIALREVVHTNVHAETLFDMARAQLGARAHVDSFNGGSLRVLHVREAADSERVVPWPLLRMAAGKSAGTTIPFPGMEPANIPVRAGQPPPLRGLGRGELTVGDGPHAVRIAYDEDGRWKDVTRQGPPAVLWSVLAALKRRDASPLETLADHLIEREAERRGDARVLMPVAVPGGVGGVLRGGVVGLRRWAWGSDVPSHDLWAVCDPDDVSRVAVASTADEAVAAWRALPRAPPAAGARSEPLAPEPPAPPSAPSPGGTPGGAVRFVLRGPSPDAPTPSLDAANAPGLLVRMAPPPGWAPAIGRWTPAFGGIGESASIALREEPWGLTLVGESLAAVLDTDGLEERLDELDEDERVREFELRRTAEASRPTELGPAPETRVRTRRYALVDERTGAPRPGRVAATSLGERFDPAAFDGVALRWTLVRVWIDDSG